jgi:anti-anti-sigma factor
MNFTVSEQPNYTLITSNVEKLDATNAAELKAEIVLLNKKGINKMVLDLTQTKYCDSSGLSAILIGNRLCKDTNGLFTIFGLQPNVKKLIQISQLDKVLSLTENLQSAEKAVA